MSRVLDIVAVASVMMRMMKKAILIGMVPAELASLYMQQGLRVKRTDRMEPKIYADTRDFYF